MNTVERLLCGMAAVGSLVAISSAQDVIVPDAVLEEESLEA